MSATYEYPFCQSCGHSVTVSSDGTLTCNLCQSTTNLANVPMAPIVTKSETTIMPAWAKSDEQQELDRLRKEADSSGNRATVEEKCPKCGVEEVEYYTLQMRSVDEGQTVFFDCPNPSCKHTWSLNN